MEHLNKQDLVEGSGQWGYALEEFFGVPVKVLMLSPLSLKESRFLLEVILSTSHLPSLKEESQTDYELKRPRHVINICFPCNSFLIQVFVSKTKRQHFYGSRD